jgi:hypothetical protein
MLYAIGGEGTRQITDIPQSRRSFFNAMMRNLLRRDHERIVNALNEHFDCVKDVDVSSFVPGSDWTGSPYEAIYDACNQNQEHAAFFFGLILWSVMVGRPDHWGFQSAKGSFSDREILGTVYFRIDEPTNGL